MQPPVPAAPPSGGAFTLREALAFSLRSIRCRLGRMGITLLGIMCAIGFMTSLIALDAILDAFAVDFPHLVPGPATRKFQRWWIAIAGAIAFVGVCNALLLSVSERTKEIGTLKCLGAVDRHIVVIFLFEAVLLGFLGGLFGGLVGILFSALGAFLQYDHRILKFVFDPGLMGLQVLRALGISTTLCFLAAALPVYLAAKKEPAEAMRYEV